MSMASARTWAVVNPSAQNALGSHTELHPRARRELDSRTCGRRHKCGSARASSTITSGPRATTRTRCTPAGAYPNQSLGGAGLPQWAANNEPLANQDVVVWYTMGVTHMPRPEEWPVMPVDARRASR